MAAFGPTWRWRPATRPRAGLAGWPLGPDDVRTAPRRSDMLRPASVVAEHVRGNQRCETLHGKRSSLPAWQSSRMTRSFVMS